MTDTSRKKGNPCQTLVFFHFYKLRHVFSTHVQFILYLFPEEGDFLFSFIREEKNFFFVIFLPHEWERVCKLDRVVSVSPCILLLKINSDWGKPSKNDPPN